MLVRLGNFSVKIPTMLRWMWKPTVTSRHGGNPICIRIIYHIVFVPKYRRKVIQ